MAGRVGGVLLESIIRLAFMKCVPSHTGKQRRLSRFTLMIVGFVNVSVLYGNIVEHAPCIQRRRCGGVDKDRDLRRSPQLDLPANAASSSAPKQGHQLSFAERSANAPIRNYSISAGLQPADSHSGNLLRRHPNPPKVLSRISSIDENESMLTWSTSLLAVQRDSIPLHLLS